MSVLLMRVSGAAVARAIADPAPRGYAEYGARTSGFFHRPARRR
jgi:steroid 5-alpha reductase family enzyme